MDVRNCKKCGKLYNHNISLPRGICPACHEEQEKKFIEVKEYIGGHRSCTVPEVAEACEVTTQQIKQWLREERLEFSTEAGDVLSCESCGEPIRTGRFCEKCKQNMANTLQNSMPQRQAPAAEPKKDSKENPKMRFLDH